MRSDEEYARHAYEVRGDIRTSATAYTQILYDYQQKVINEEAVAAANNTTNQNSKTENNFDLPIMFHNDSFLEYLSNKNNDNSSTGLDEDCFKLISQLESILHLHHTNFIINNCDSTKREDYEDEEVKLLYDLVINSNNKNKDQEEEQKLLSDLQYLIVSYNLGVFYYVISSSNSFDNEKVIKLLLPVYSQFENQIKIQRRIAATKLAKGNSNQVHLIETMRDVQCKIAFLLLDAMLEQTKGTDSITNSQFMSNLTNVFDWIQKYVMEMTKKCSSKSKDQNSSNKSKRQHQQNHNQNGGDENDSNNHSYYTNESITELKYRLHLYNTKIQFLREYEPKQSATKARVARKELKNAMEIYHRKLAATTTTAANNNNINNNNTSTTQKNSSGTSKVSGGSTIHSKGGGSLDESVSISSNTINHTSFHMDYFTPNNQLLSSSTDMNNVDEIEKKTILQNKKLHGQNQYALYLKAKLEYLKGNAKKSLKLCAEALHANERRREFLKELLILTNVSNNDDENNNDTNINVIDMKSTGSNHDNHDGNKNCENADTTNTSKPHFTALQRSKDLDSAIYYNNLAIVHQSSGKVYIAMHYYAKALSFLENIEKTTSTTINFEIDGSATPLPKYEVMYNIALCAHQIPGTTNASISYECLAKCVHGSRIFRRRPRCWLRMTESCIRIHCDLKANAVADFYSSSNIKVPRESSSDNPCVLIDDNTEELMIQKNYDPIQLKDEDLSNVLGSESDIAQVVKNPLPRAIYCIHQCLVLCNYNNNNNNEDDVVGPEATMYKNYIESAMVLLAYAWLELKEYASALSVAQLILSQSKETANDFIEIENDNNNFSDNDNDNCWKLSHRKNIACARMYACEAYCAMGNLDEAKRVLLFGAFGKEENDDSNKQKFENMAEKEQLNALAHDLASFSLMNDSEHMDNEPASTVEWNQRKHHDAMTSVYTMAAGVAVLQGNLNTANQYAKAAVSFGEYTLSGKNSITQKKNVKYSNLNKASYSSLTGKNSIKARKTLLYCFLRNGQMEDALLLLQSFTNF